MNKLAAMIQKEKLEKFDHIEKSLMIIRKIESIMKTEKFSYFEGETYGMRFSSNEVIEKFNRSLRDLIECDKAILIKEMEEL